MIQYVIISGYHSGDDIERATVIFVSQSFTCFFWLTVIVVTIFEADIITAMLKFQANLEDEDLYVQKCNFQQKENRIYKCYGILMVFNLVYHVSRVIVYFIGMAFS